MGNVIDATGNVIDKTVRGLSPVTWVDGITGNKTWYDCPVCGRRVYAYGSMAGTKCLDCPGRSYKSSQQSTIDSQAATISSHEITISNQKSTISNQKSTIDTYKTAKNNMDDERKTASKSCQEKREKFIPEVQQLMNKIESDSKSNDSDSPSISLSELENKQNEIDEILKDCKSSNAKTQEFIDLSKDLGEAASQVPTYEEEEQMQKDIDKCTEAQEKLMNCRKAINDQNEKLTKEKNKASKKIIDIEEKLIKTRNAETELNKDSVKMDKLRLDLNKVTGSEINANPDAHKAMKEKFDELCKLIRTKHADNKAKLNELKECEKRVKKMEAKLIKQHSDNKYLAGLIDEEYKRLGAAVDGAMQKFEERGTYFFSVTVGLKSDVIEQLEDIVGDDHDMDMIKGLTDQHLINAGILDDLLRGKILKKVAKLNAGK